VRGTKFREISTIRANRIEEPGGISYGIFDVHFVFAGSGSLCLGGRVPGSGARTGGFLTSAIVGVIGAWLGSSMMGSFGPSLAGVPLLPAIVGSALLIFLFSLLSGALARRGI